jgi:hypothetical protein
MEFRGTVLRRDEHELVGVVDSHGDGYVRLCVESCGGEPMAWLWLARWDGGDVAAVQACFDGIARSLFGHAVHGFALGAARDQEASRS